MSVLNTGSVVNGLGFQGKKPTSEKILGKDDFMRLLVTQLNNQNPLEPLKATDFSSQLAQFSSVEQLFNIQESLQASLDANYLLATSINNTLAATVIGKDVRASGNQVYFNGSDSTDLRFDLADDAKEITIEIVDSNGTVVRTIQAQDLKSGENQLSWDGKDNNGVPVAEGSYEFRVTAKDEEGNNITATPFITGTITGVRYGENGATLMLGDVEIALSDVLEILMPNEGR